MTDTATATDQTTLTGDQREKISENEKDKARFQSGGISTSDKLSSDTYSTFSDLQLVLGDQVDSQRAQQISKFSALQNANVATNNSVLRTGVLYPTVIAAVQQNQQVLDHGVVRSNVLNQLQQARDRQNRQMRSNPYAGLTTRKARRVWNAKSERFEDVQDTNVHHSATHRNIKRVGYDPENASITGTKFHKQAYTDGPTSTHMEDPTDLPHTVTRHTTPGMNMKQMMAVASQSQTQGWKDPWQNNAPDYSTALNRFNKQAASAPAAAYPTLQFRPETHTQVTLERPVQAGDVTLSRYDGSAPTASTNTAPTPPAGTPTDGAPASTPAPTPVPTPEPTTNTSGPRNVGGHYLDSNDRDKGSFIYCKVSRGTVTPLKTARLMFGSKDPTRNAKLYGIFLRFDYDTAAGLKQKCNDVLSDAWTRRKAQWEDIVLVETKDLDASLIDDFFYEGLRLPFGFSSASYGLTIVAARWGESAKSTTQNLYYIDFKFSCTLVKKTNSLAYGMSNQVTHGSDTRYTTGGPDTVNVPTSTHVGAPTAEKMQIGKWTYDNINTTPKIFDIGSLALT